jgi:glycosyltransferase involved in cell wall biosynthesis
LLVPDECVTWALTAIPVALRLVRTRSIDAVLTTSPPTSVHLVGAAVAAATGIPWVADVRDSVVANPHRDTDSRAARLKERGHRRIAELVARRAAAVVAASEVIADEFAAARGRVVTIRNGCDFEDFEGLEYVAGARFRITHAGTFFGQRDPRSFLEAHVRSCGDAVARFVGSFRAVDRDWAGARRLGDRLELYPFQSRRRALVMMRDSEALLLLMPERGAASRVIPAKLFDYLGAARPILAAVPADSAAAALVRRTGSGIVVPPDDVDALASALTDLESQWRAGRLEPTPLEPDVRRVLSRRARAGELAELLRDLA